MSVGGTQLDHAQLLAELLRTVPMAAAIFDRDLRYLAHNAAWLSLHGEPPESTLVGLAYDAAFTDISASWRETLTHCVAHGSTERLVSRFLDRGEGRSEHLRWLIAPWHDARGDRAGVIMYGESITEQVRTLERLAERESMIRDLFEHSPIGLNLCRMDGLWLESNPAFLDIIGYSQEEADGGLTYWQLTPRAYDADEATQLEQLRTTRRYGPYEKEFIRKDGRLVPVRLNGFVIAREGVDYIWSLIEDLTAQRALEASLEEERLKAIQTSKLAVLGEMAASLAHEINNPLGIIDAYAYTLRGAIAKHDVAHVDEALAAIRDGVVRAGKIVHGLRKFARQSDRDARDEIRIADVIEDALDLCRARIRTHGVHVDVEVSTTAKVRGHEIELSQVIVNLMNNAFDAAQASDARSISIQAHDLPGLVEIAVEDSGAGVPEHLRDSIFKPFFTTKQVGKGTGLGLSISRNIVEHHGGTLTLDGSTPRTRFVVRLPI